MKLTSRFKALPNKRLLGVIISVVVLLLILIFCYGIWSNMTWKSYDSMYASWSDDAKQRLSSSLQTKVSNNQQRLDKISRIRETVQALDQSAQTTCKVNPLVKWQSFIDDLKKKEEECQNNQGKVMAFTQKLRPILTFLDDEQKVVKTLDGIPKNKDQLDEKTWESQVTTLQNALKIAEKLSVGSDATPLKQATLASVKENVAAWQELIAAHKAKDRARYENAQVRLVKSYSAYDGLATLSTERLEKLAKELPDLL